MGNSSYFRFDDDNKTKYIYFLNHEKEMGKLKNTAPRMFADNTYCPAEVGASILVLCQSM